LKKLEAMADDVLKRWGELEQPLLSRKE